ncbi:MAG: hypothetical protein IJU76_00450 [Desulfovibrionaceae bacterium]|nr:hypothetical protein [Desulfovibrionaceae bacterium]
MKRSRIDLSAIAGINLLNVSLALRHRTASHEVNCEVGEYEGRFYLLDFTTDRVERITWGLFRNLSAAWRARKLEIDRTAANA